MKLHLISHLCDKIFWRGLRSSGGLTSSINTCIPLHCPPLSLSLFYFYFYLKHNGFCKSSFSLKSCMELLSLLCASGSIFLTVQERRGWICSLKLLICICFGICSATKCFTCRQELRLPSESSLCKYLG